MTQRRLELNELALIDAKFTLEQFAARKYVKRDSIYVSLHNAAAAWPESDLGDEVLRVRDEFINNPFYWADQQALDKCAELALYCGKQLDKWDLDYSTPHPPPKPADEPAAEKQP